MICDLDGVGLLISTISTHSKNSKVVKNACLALASLVEINGNVSMLLHVSHFHWQLFKPKRKILPGTKMHVYINPPMSHCYGICTVDLTPGDVMPSDITSKVVHLPCFPFPFCNTFVRIEIELRSV